MYEPDTIIDLMDDCREVAGVLGSTVDVNALKKITPPSPRPSLEISMATAAAVAGFEEYGS